MKFGIVGLGRMGGRWVLHGSEHGFAPEGQPQDWALDASPDLGLADRQAAAGSLRIQPDYPACTTDDTADVSAIDTGLLTDLPRQYYSAQRSATSTEAYTRLGRERARWQSLTENGAMYWSE